ncbi:TRAP transporter substrate-binding protein DctP [Chloroflexota bacterium]
MKKIKKSIRGGPLVILAAILVVVPLLGIACSDDDASVNFNAEFSATPTTGFGTVEVQFTDQSDGVVTSWSWDFGDGEGSNEQNPAHSYTEVGLYTVTLTVTGPDGSDTETKAQYISVTAVDYPEMSLTLATLHTETEVMGKCAQKFADLLDAYTGGSVEVLLYLGSSLYSPQEEFQMLKIGGADITSTNVVLLRMLVDPNFDAFNVCDRIFPSLTASRAMMEDERIPEIHSGMMADLGVKLLGPMENILVGSVYTTVRELAHLSDGNGLKYASNVPGAVDPWHEYAGFDCIYVPYADRNAALALGTLDTSTTSVENAVSLGYTEMFKHALIWTAYSPNYMLMNMDTWNSLGADLQDLISNKIMPELWTYSQEESVQANKDACAILNTGLETLNFETPAESAAIWDVIENYSSTQNILGRIDPEILSIIYEFRPTTWEIDPEIEEILEYAGITWE